MVNSWDTRILQCIVVIVTVIVADRSGARGDEAVDRTGSRHQGSLVQKGQDWVFQREGMPALPIADLAFVRFSAGARLLPKTPLRWTLLLPHAERVSGMLREVDEKKLTFITAWGQRITLDRHQATGVIVANDAMPVLHDDFEEGVKEWRLERNPGVSGEQAYFDKASLMLDDPGQTASRVWKPMTGDGAVHLYFHDPADDLRLKGTIRLLTDAAPESALTLEIDRGEYRGINLARTWPTLPRSKGWHFVAFERRGDRLRLFVDDHSLGEILMADKVAITGLRVAFEAKSEKAAKSRFFFDELNVTRRVPPLPLPTPGNDQDLVWLEDGEQLFGRIIAADSRGAVLDAKFGKRTFAWSKVRGILFARGNAAPAAEGFEFSLQPGPGFALDLVRAKLVRWEDAKVVVRHGIFGEIIFERERLEKVRFEGK